MPCIISLRQACGSTGVMNRGDQREDILRDDQDRQQFLSTLGEASGKTEWQVHAYCLLRNHFHLVLVKTVDLPQEGLALGRRWHVRGCCLRARSSGHAGRVAG